MKLCHVNRVTTCLEKPGNVREFDSCQGNIGNFTKSQGKNLVREKLLKTVYCRLHICAHTGI